MNRNKRMSLLSDTPVTKSLLALGLPTMTGMLINALYNLADTYFAGGLGTEQMGAVTIVYPLGQIIVGLGLLFGNGAAAIFISAAFLNPILTQMGASGNILPQALSYSRIYIIFSIFNIFNAKSFYQKF